MPAPRLTTYALLLSALVVATGCGGESKSKTTTITARMDAPPQVAGEPAPAAGAKPAAANAQAEAPDDRRIVFSGALDVVVKDFDAARAELVRVVGQAKGYFSKTEVVGNAGAKRSGTFAVKLPAPRFQTTVDEIARLGVAVKNSTDSQDVTEEFVDVQARVRNLKAEEETLNRLLKDAAGRLDDVFKIREQIRGVRGDIERAEGRVKVLTALTSLSTIQVTLREETPYVPPTVDPPPAPPTFGERIGTTFAASVDVLRQVGEGLAVILTAVLPWLPVAVAAALVLRWLGRRLVAAAGAPPAPPAPRVARRLVLPPEPAAEPAPPGGEPG